MATRCQALVCLVFAIFLPVLGDGLDTMIFAWADRHGIDRSKVAVKKFKHGGNMIRGIGATRDIEAGEVILSIPEHLILRSWAKPSVEACNGLWETTTDPHSHMILTVLLERSRGQASLWYEAIQGYPSLADYATFYPYAARKELRREFKSLDIISAHKEWRDNLVFLRKNAKRFGKCFPELPSADDFLWAECVVSTRQYTMSMVKPDDDDDGHVASVPLSDYANVADNPGDNENTDWTFHPGPGGQFKGDGKFVVTATKTIRAGEEILELYHGGDSGADYLLDTWGFMAPPGHGAREVLEPLSIQACADLQPAIQKYLSHGSCNGPYLACNLATLAQLQCADDSEL